MQSGNCFTNTRSYYEVAYILNVEGLQEAFIQTLFPSMERIAFLRLFAPFPAMQGDTYITSLELPRCSDNG